jgi:hypothetical protein
MGLIGSFSREVDLGVVEVPIGEKVDENDADKENSKHGTMKRLKMRFWRRSGTRLILILLFPLFGFCVVIFI